MNLVATLIANPAARNLDAAMVDRLAGLIGAQSLHWLSESLACDLFLPPITTARKAEALLRKELEGLNIDLVVQPADGRKKKLLIADMDSTMIDQECIDELAEEVGLKEKVSRITALAMNGEIPFEDAVHERVALLEGLPANVVAKILETRITIASGARTLVQTMRKNGARTILVSGGFTAFTSHVAQKIGFHEDYANVLMEDGGFFTGKVRLPVLGADAKVETMLKVTADMSIGTKDVIAVGDGANDLPMLMQAGSGIALHAKPVVAEQASLRIDHGDLESLLYIQGYNETEIVS